MNNTVIQTGRKLFIIGMMSIVATTSQAHSTPQTTLPDMTETLRTEHVESASVAVIRHGRIVSEGAWGTAGPNRPATVQTPYNLASLTKPLTAEVILRLISANKWSLDESMDRYWSDPDLSRDTRRMKLTVRLALSHRTGFPNWRDGAGLVFDHDPGTVVGYSGEGYQYAARYAERRTGQSFEALAEKWLFAPAKMQTSGYISAQGASQPLATAYDANGRPLESEPVTHYNAADLAHATAVDYARFLISTRSDKRLSSSIAAERNRLQADLKPAICAGARATTCPEWTGFGLGWQLLGFSDGTTMLHTGKDAGAFTFAAINRKSGDGIVILTNSDNGWRVILPILERTKSDPKLIAFLHGQMN